MSITTSSKERKKKENKLLPCATHFRLQFYKNRTVTGIIIIIIIMKIIIVILQVLNSLGRCASEGLDSNTVKQRGRLIVSV